MKKTVKNNPEKIKEIIYDWIREDATISVKMFLNVGLVKKLIVRLVAGLS